MEDVKSVATKTDVYKIKKKLFKNKFPEIIFFENVCNTSVFAKGAESKKNTNTNLL